MPSYFDFEVSLMGIKPRIWRRFLMMAWVWAVAGITGRK